MKKIMILLCTLLVFSAVGCGSQPAAEEDSGKITGSITMSGSTSMEKYASAMNEAFSMEYPAITAEAQYTGSSAGIEAVAAGTVEIGNSSRALKEEEKANGIVENIVAIDGIAVITDNANVVTNVSIEDLTNIYKGEIKNWKELGGSDQAIVVIGREAGSGTRNAFEEILGIKDQCHYVQEIDSTGAVMAKVAATPGAIGYVSLDVLNNTVHAVTINAVAPTVETIKDGSYPLSRPFVMATKGEISQQSPAVQAYFDFIHSETGQSIITQVGLVPAT